MDQHKQALISAKILAFVANGATLPQAMDYVLGPGYYDCLVDELYTALRVKAETTR